MTRTSDLFGGEVPAEIPLPRAPLERVIAQVRFPPVTSISRTDYIGPFQESIRPTYAVLKPDVTHGVVSLPSGLSAESQVVWRFSDTSSTWRVSLAQDFIALDTTGYVSRDDFLRRLEVVLAALDVHIHPSTATRLGIRYINRLRGTALTSVAKLVKPEVRGIVGAEVGAHAVHSLAESVFDFGDQGQILTRWGLLPSRRTTDPTAIEIIDEPSWILDVDMFSAVDRPFDVATIVATSRVYATQIYGFFRRAITDEYITYFGGRS